MEQQENNRKKWLASVGAAVGGAFGLVAVVRALRRRGKHEEGPPKKELHIVREISRGKVSRQAVDSGHEPSDVHIGGIIAVAIGMIISAVIIYAALGLFFGALQHGAEEAKGPPPPQIDTSQLPPEPRLQASPAVDLVRVQATATAQLNSYGWVDRQAGIVHIPIDQAMDLIVQRGLPAREK
jgi:hypothetical protein